MSKRSLLLVAGAGCVLLASRPAAAQTADSTAKATAVPNDSLYLRARKLVLDGNGGAGRALVDSAVTATTGTPEYATALYWRAALATTAADAERDYRRIIVEYPFSTHSGDALLALAQLEMARGDRDPAIDHLQRFLLQHPNDPERVRAGISLGRLLLEQNQQARGCAVLLRTRAALGDTAVEVRNQVDYYASRCVGVDTTAPPPRVASQPTQPQPARAQPANAQPRKPQPRTDTLPSPRPATKESARIDTARKPAARRDSGSAATTKKRYTIQVAAYDTKSAAEELASRLAARGIVARVIDTGRAPYRVRIGHYSTDAEATTAARDLKGKGIEGFVTTTDNEAATTPARR